MHARRRGRGNQRWSREHRRRAARCALRDELARDERGARAAPRGRERAGRGLEPARGRARDSARRTLELSSRGAQMPLHMSLRAKAQRAALREEHAPMTPRSLHALLSQAPGSGRRPTTPGAAQALPQCHIRSES